MKNLYQNRISGFSIALLLAFSVFVTGCDTGSDAKTGTMTVEMTDAPIDTADAVNVDIERVEVNRVGDPDGWTTLNETKETYDLLNLANGATAVIGSAALEAGTYPQIRLVLAEEGHSVEVDGNVYDMKVPSGAQTGIKLNINAEIEEDIEYVVLLDFDASRSVVQAGSSEQVPYLLNPVVKAKEKAITGNIEGTVEPAGSEPVVYAIDNSGTEADTLASTVANTEDGYFKLIGLEEGTYDVSIDPRNDNYAIENITDVSVTVEETNSLGTIQVSQN